MFYVSNQSEFFGLPTNGEHTLGAESSLDSQKENFEIKKLLAKAFYGLGFNFFEK